MENSISGACCSSREVKNFAMDSSRWAALPFRNGDIVIASYARSGTTWVQQIVAQLLLGPDSNPNLEHLSPWIEHRATPLPILLRRLDAQTHRRFVKTHLPADAVPYSATTRYLVVARDGRDVALSLYHFQKNHTALAYRIMQRVAGNNLLAPQPLEGDFSQFFADWLDRDGHPWWPFWSNVRSWWLIKDRANVCMVHFSDLKADLWNQVKRIAAFLEVEVGETALGRITETCTFERMKERSPSMFGRYTGELFSGGMRSFFRRGAVGEWKTGLTEEQNAAYQERAVKELPQDCAAWLSRA